ncbi:hypothetical protein C8R45DRAFT_1162667 [Mycena sanguinolenta]|nr:hypothetical protein C8R45DRAFT_1162667 [Mycena sanguinolenta]
MSSARSSGASATQPSQKQRWNLFKSRSSKFNSTPATGKSGRDSRSHETVNIQISGGRGGNGGDGGLLGGGGGTGEGPMLLYNIKTEQIIMNTVDTGSVLNAVHTSPAVVQASQAINHCPPPSKIFHGRAAILESMHQFFTQDTGKQQIYVLYGLGGAGKTQIALKFIEESSYFTDQLLIDASSTDTIETGLKNIAVTKQTGTSSQDALMWLASKHEEWLLFLDNADDPEINLNQFFPQCSHGNIIITTRNHGARIHGAHSEVSNMEEPDAVALLLKSAQCETSVPNELLATQIVKALCHFALAIVQAGAFISETEALDTYLDLFLKNQTELLRRKSTQTHDNYACAVYTTWEMSFSKLSSPAAMFLKLCSFLHQDDISEDIFSRATNHLAGVDAQAFPPSQYKPKNLERFKSSFTRFFASHSSQSHSSSIITSREFLSYFMGPTGKWNSLQFMEVIKEIKAYSLINYNTERNSFSIHPLVHSWSRTTLVNLEPHHSCMGEILGMSINEILEKDIKLSSLRLVSHVDSLMQAIPEPTTLFSTQYANIYYYAGQYTAAEELEAREVERRRKCSGDDHPDTLRAMHSLAITYDDLGRFEKAEKLYAAVLEKQKKFLGNDHLDTLHTMLSLATTYDNLGQFEEAKKLKIEVLEKWQKLLGDDHPDTLQTMHNLANTYNNLGQFEEAKKLNIEVLEKRQKLLRDDHPDTLHTMHNLATSYDNLGQFEEAKKLEIEVLQKRRKLLGDDHLETLHTMHNLAVSYDNLGQFEEAKKLKIAVLQKRRKLLGDDHLETLRTMHNLAVSYDNLGQFEEAKKVKIEVLEKQAKLLGDDHLETLHTMHNLAVSYDNLGQFEEAKKVKIEVLEKRAKLLGDDHLETLRTMHNLAITYDNLGQFEEAEKLKVVVFEERKKLLGDDHPNTLTAMNNLAVTHYNMGRFEEAEKLYVVVLQKRRRLLGDNHPDTLQAMKYLAETYECLG